MTENEIYAAIQARFPDHVLAVQEATPPANEPLKKGKEVIEVMRPRALPYGPACYGWIQIKPEALLDVLTWSKTAPGIELNFPHCLSGVDYAAGQPLGVSYHFTNVQHKHWAHIKVFLDRDQPVIDSVTSLFPGMDWHEREAFDLLGIRFRGHPNMRRILCAEDWEGYPLRKDYEFPETYHGIPTGKEVRWNS